MRMKETCGFMKVAIFLAATCFCVVADTNKSDELLTENPLLEEQTQNSHFKSSQWNLPFVNIPRNEFTTTELSNAMNSLGIFPADLEYLAAQRSPRKTKNNVISNPLISEDKLKALQKRISGLYSENHKKNEEDGMNIFHEHDEENSYNDDNFSTQPKGFRLRLKGEGHQEVSKTNRVLKKDVQSAITPAKSSEINLRRYGNDWNGRKKRRKKNKRNKQRKNNYKRRKNNKKRATRNEARTTRFKRSTKVLKEGKRSKERAENIHQSIDLLRIDLFAYSLRIHSVHASEQRLELTTSTIP